MNVDWKKLDWDSNFFGYGVAEITAECLSSRRVREIKEELEKKDIRLLYWKSDLSTKSKIAAIENNGIYVDRKTVYTKCAPERYNNDDQSIKVVEYSSPHMCGELRSLAIQASKYSRFSVDTNFLQGASEALYEKWMEGSINNSIAEAVLVAKNENKIVGMVTLGGKNGVGDIGLIAVDSRERSRGIGCRLLSAANNWFYDKGYTKLQVVTQGDNLPACKLYEKCGYTVEEIHNFYHFWLHRA